MKITIAAVGDIMLGRGVSSMPNKEFVDLVDPELLEWLAADVVTANLECILGMKGAPCALSHSHFRADPGRAASLLRLFHVVSLANNHINDFGPEAIQETICILDQLRVKWVGIGRTRDEATQPAVIEASSRRIAIFGATTVSTLRVGDSYCASTPDEYLWRKVTAYKDAGYVCLLHLHTGGGDLPHPAPFVRHLMRDATRAGCDVVLGHHPHVVQGYEKFNNGKAIAFYSLGDFLFDKLEGGRDKALLVKLQKSDDNAGFEIAVRPVKRFPDLRICPMGPGEHALTLSHIEELSVLISSGASDNAYRSTLGCPLKILASSILKDVRTGGLTALVAKIGRLDRRRLSLLFPWLK